MRGERVKRKLSGSGVGVREGGKKAEEATTVVAPPLK
jgi:hypothetical protein